MKNIFRLAAMAFLGIFLIYTVPLTANYIVSQKVLAQHKISEPPQNEVTVLAFIATGCNPCKRIKPILVSIRAAGVKVDIIDINTRAGAALARRMGVESVPTFFVHTKTGTTRTQNIYVVLRIIAENKK